MSITLLTHWAWFALFGAMYLLIAGNNIIQLIRARRQGGGTTLTLFLGGVFGAAAVIACPIEGAWIWFWVPALVDPGSVPAIYQILRARRASKKAATHTNTPLDH